VYCLRAGSGCDGIGPNPTLRRGFNSAWTPASNFVVGVYMNGAGVSVVAMDAQGIAYAETPPYRTPLDALKKTCPRGMPDGIGARQNCR
jgi:hypothetical protein